MRRTIALAGILLLAVMGLVPAGTALADSVSIGINTGNLNLGISVGEPPKLVVVPGTPVQYAPAVTANYFFYGNRYYLFHNETWYIASGYNGPWTVIAIQRVPPPILTVPVEYYRVPPGHWKGKHGPPPWAAAKGYDKDRKHKGNYKEKKRRGRGHGGD